MTDEPEPERELRVALLDALDQLREGLLLALYCWERDIERVLSDRDHPKSGASDAPRE